MNALEGNVRSKMSHDEPNLLDDALIPSGDVVSLQKGMREMRARYEVSTSHPHLTQSYLTMPSGKIDLEQIRKRLTEAEAKSARTVHDVWSPVFPLANLLSNRSWSSLTKK